MSSEVEGVGVNCTTEFHKHFEQRQLVRVYEIIHQIKVIFSPQTLFYYPQTKYGMYHTGLFFDYSYYLYLIQKLNHSLCSPPLYNFYLIYFPFVVKDGHKPSEKA